MELLHVPEILHGEREAGWSRLACGQEALILFREMERVRSSWDAYPQIMFLGGDVMYTVDFFTVLLSLILRSPHSDWFTEAFDMSDLHLDRTLGDLCREALEIA